MGNVPRYDWTEVPSSDRLPSQIEESHLSAQDDVDAYWNNFEEEALRKVDARPEKKRTGKALRDAPKFPLNWRSTSVWKDGFVMSPVQIAKVERYQTLAGRSFWTNDIEAQQLADAVGIPTWVLRLLVKRRLGKSLGSQDADGSDMALFSNLFKSMRHGRRGRRKWYNERFQEALEKYPEAAGDSEFLQGHLKAHKNKWIKGDVDLSPRDMRNLISASVKMTADSVIRRAGKKGKGKQEEKSEKAACESHPLQPHKCFPLTDE